MKSRNSWKIAATLTGALLFQAHYAPAYGQATLPFVTRQPVSATNYPNLPVGFTVDATGTAPVSYQWNKVGTGPIAAATNSVFSIPNLAPTDSGTYNCGITNPVGGIFSSNFTITVLPPPNHPPVIRVWSCT